jgi:hypothetical protein
MAELVDAARKLAELAEGTGASSQPLVAGALEKIQEAIYILKQRRSRNGVFKRVKRKRYGFKPPSKKCHALSVTDKGMTLFHPGGQFTEPFQVPLADALEQKGIYPSVFCKFPLGDDSRLTVTLNLRAEAEEEDIPGFFTVKFFHRGKLVALPKVFYLR